MARETWAVGNYVLTDGAVRDVEVREGLYVAAETREAHGVAVGGRHGVLPRRRRPLDAGAFALQLWLGADTRAELEAAYDELLRNVHRTDDLVRWSRGLADGTSRFCYGVVADQLEPVPIGQLGMRVGLSVVIPSGRWWSTNTAPHTIVPPASGYMREELPEFARMTAPSDRLTVELEGPMTDPSVVDDRTARGFTYRGALAAGEVVTLDTERFTATGGSPGAVEYDGATWLELQPGNVDGPPAVRVEAANPGAGAAVRLYGAPAFLA